MNSEYELSSLRIIIKQVGELGSTEANLAYVITDVPFERNEEGVIYREFERFFERDTETEWMRDGYFLQEKRSTHEWGSSGFIWQILIEAGGHVPEAVIGTGVTKTLEVLVKKLGKKPRANPTYEEALNRAQYAILLGYPELRRDDLGVLTNEEVDLANSRYSFTWRPGDAHEYIVEISTMGGIPEVAKITRRLLE
jgi:hypothetical protein